MTLADCNINQIIIYLFQWFFYYDEPKVGSDVPDANKLALI